MTIEADLPALIQKAAFDEIAVLEALLAATPSPGTSGTKSTVATRKAAQRKAIEELDIDRLLELQAKMNSLIDVITGNDLAAWDDVLDEEKATKLMAETLDVKEVAEALDARRDMVKEAVFTHIDRVFGPNENGHVDAPDLGKKFTREGCGYGTPRVDEQRLQGLLGDRWVDACEEVIIPPTEARIEYKLSIEKVLDLAHQDPEVLEALRTCLVPGKPKSPRFVVRDL
jgi:hypothetical protein